MRILYHHRIASKDGQYVHVEELVAELKKLGHEVCIVGPSVTASASFGSDSGALRLLRKMLPKTIYELLELAYCLLDFSRLVLAVWRFKPSIIYERFNLFTPSGIWVQRLFGLPLISEVNAPLVEERSAFGGLALQRVARWSQRYVWTNADCVITVTEVLRNIILKYGAAPTNVEVMANGVDLSKFQYDEDVRVSKRTSLGIDDRFILGFTGFVREWHALENVLNLLPLPAFTNAVLLIVGDGPAVQDLRDHAERIGVSDRFFVTGIVPREEVSKYISTFDIALQARVVEYASPLKVIEYLALGRAIVAPRTPNITEILSDGKNAILFSESDAAEMQSAFESIMKDKQHRDSLQRAAIESIHTLGLTWSRNASRVSTIADRLIGDARS